MIPVTATEILQKLAALGRDNPERPAGTEGPPAPSAGAVPDGGQGGEPSSRSLGRLDVGKYLSDHGISHKVKPKGDATLYVLGSCLFDQNHKGGEAAIVSGPRGYFYQCFHASCADRTWSEARRHISGDKKLTEWMEGYDPQWKKKQKKKAREDAAATTGKDLVPAAAPGGVPGEPERSRYARVDNLVNDLCSTRVILLDGTVSPAPMEVNHMEFYEKKGSRTEFVPRYAANYLIEHLSPIAYSGGHYWRYRNGVWKSYPEEEIAQVLAHAMKEKIQGRMLEGTLKVLQALILVPEEKWAPDHNKVNVLNGMLDVTTMELTPHAPEHYSRVQLPVNYSPNAKSEKWWDFLKSVFPEDYEKLEDGTYNMKTYLMKNVLAMQFAGYCLLRDCRYQKALFLYGSGSNGKSTFLNIIGAVLGAENTCSLSLTTLGERFKSIYLHNKMANLASETNPKAALESDIFNSVVSGDEITAEEKYGKSLKFRPYCKFIISMNEPPVVQDKTYAFERRILVLNFNYRFAKEEINPRMTDELMGELDAVFAWMIEGLRMLLKHDGFVIGENIQEEINHMMSRVNPFIIFAEECLIFADHMSTPTQEVWEIYRDWCREGGNKPLGRNKMLDQVLVHYPTIKKKRQFITDELTGEESFRNVFIGIGLNFFEAKRIRERLAARRGEYRSDRQERED